MLSNKASIVEVIMVEEGANRIYYTLEGVQIGSFMSGKVTAPVVQEKVKKHRGGIVRSPTPKEVRLTDKRNLEENMKVENRLEHMKEVATDEMP